MSNFKQPTSKNGYEIRADILALANKHVEVTYSCQIQQWEYSGRTTTMPQIPQLVDILAAAEELYEFVNNK